MSAACKRQFSRSRLTVSITFELDNIREAADRSHGSREAPDSVGMIWARADNGPTERAKTRGRGSRRDPRPVRPGPKASERPGNRHRDRGPGDHAERRRRAPESRARSMSRRRADTGRTEGSAGS